jgi:hypothetical protein
LSLKLRQRSELKGRLQIFHQIALESLILVLGKKRVKEHDDKKKEEIKLYVGDTVLQCDKTVRRGRSRKLSSPWIRPYEIVAIDKVHATT